MAAKGQPGTIPPARNRSLQSKRFYWLVGTVAAALAGVVLYYSFYVSSQRDYHDQRAFRLLAIMGDSVVGRVGRVRDVLTASVVDGRDLDTAAVYVHNTMAGILDPKDFHYNNFFKNDKKPPSRDGLLFLSFPADSNSLRLPVEYVEFESKDASQSPKCSDKPDPASLDVLVCATVDFEPLLRPTLLELDEKFFDDILITDSDGEVLYQQFPSEVRVKNLASVLPSQESSKTGSNPSTERGGSSGIGGLVGNLFSSVSPSPSLSALSSASHQEIVDLAGTSYRMYVQPLPLSLRKEQKERRLMICGLRNLKKTQSEALSLPYTYLIWGILLALTFFALSWPLLKLVYMSPKERLRTRQVLYLIFSVLFGTVLLTLTALNLSYQLASKDQSESDLEALASRIKGNVTEELRNSLHTLDAMTEDPDLLRHFGSDWNVADFFKEHSDFDKHYSSLSERGALPYPYFSYFFLVDKDGDQLLKFTVHSTKTPKTNVHDKDYFVDIKEEESHNQPASHHSASPFDQSLATLPKTNQDPGEHPYRLQPLFSPNTGEFIVILAVPASKSDDARLKQVSAKVLVVKMESLDKPVLPSGYGYAIVDNQGSVQFHSVATRNLVEDFSKESRADAAVAALRTQHGSDAVEVMYMGAEKLLWVTPIEIMGKPSLTLIVFRDSTYFTTLNVAVFTVFLLLISCYAFFFAVAVAIRLLCRHTYPLAIIWPDRSRIHRYMQIIVANLFLTLTFFAGYITFDSSRVFLNVFFVAVAAVVYVYLQSGSLKAIRLGNLFVFLVMTGLVHWDWRLLLPLGFAVVVSFPTLAVLERWCSRRLRLKYVYTALAVSMFVVLAIVPSCGFFKVSYDYVQRVFLQRQQLDLAERLKERRHRIHEFYVHRFASWLVDERWGLGLDRYDRAFLNSEIEDKDKDKLGPGVCLQTPFLQRTLASLTARFPANELGAELRELAAGGQVPGGSAKANPADIAGPQASSGAFWTLFPGADAGKPQSRMLAMTLDKCGLEALKDLKPEDQIVSPYPSWPALDWRGRLLLFAAFGVLTLWIYFVTSRIFLANLHSAPPLELWDPAEEDAKNLLILGHPKSGKRLSAEDIPGHQIVDLAEMVTTGNWKIPAPMNRVIVLDHFEFHMDNAGSNLEKLGLLEHLTYVEHAHIVILSAIDPLYYLTSAGTETLCPEKPNLASAMQLLDRWAAVLTPFSKRQVEDVNQQSLLRVLTRTRARRTNNPQVLRFVGWVQSECDHTAQLRRLGKMIVRSYRNKPNSELSRERLLEELLDRGDAYYRALWSTCTADERLVLFQLAEDGWANPMNELAIQQLLRRGLIRRAPGLRLMNDSFRRFIHNSQQDDEVAIWKQEGDQSVWRSLKLVLILVGGLMILWLVYAQQQFFNAAIGYISAIGAATGVVIKLVSDFRGGKSSGGSS
jgi:hypothetical protein